ncbi:DM13 domain-containing protein [Oscillatoria sp. CS-180]|uniref:DM13 domain-containing protein n=1 Tax=Oscillatoria sp. CS-180 TaxID=3021720 RepID=UPI00232AB764|nr:DM13 domain-containing protein [Oscillatoria sp. CS-180]
MSSESESEPAESVQTEEAETVPTSETAPSSVDETTEAIARTGLFESAEHETSGAAELISEEGQQTLRFDASFSTSNGPDLVVVLHRSADLIEETTPPAYPLNEADYVVIAPLSSTTGVQEYVIPAEINVEAFEAVAIWCQEFNATFGAAPLQ